MLLGSLLKRIPVYTFGFNKTGLNFAIRSDQEWDLGD